MCVDSNRTRYIRVKGVTRFGTNAILTVSPAWPLSWSSRGHVPFGAREGSPETCVCVCVWWRKEKSWTDGETKKANDVNATIGGRS
jgi:hypothetical protein